MSMFIDVERDGAVVIREIEATRADSLLAAIMDAVNKLHSVIERLELRPHRDMVDARIVVAPDQEGGERGKPLALVDALLASLQTAEAAAPQ